MNSTPHRWVSTERAGYHLRKPIGFVPKTVEPVWKDLVSIMDVTDSALSTLYEDSGSDVAHTSDDVEHVK